MADVQKRALVTGVATLLTRASGLVREVAFAAVFGAGVDADAWNAAFRVHNLFRDLFAEGSMANAFVPNFSRTTEEEGAESGFALANAVLGVALAAAGLIGLVMAVFAEPWVYLVAAGFSEVPGKVERTAQVVRLVTPFLASVSAASLFGGVLNVHRRFFVPAVAPAVFNVAIVIACLLPGPIEALTGLEPLWTVAIAATLGGVLQALVQLPALARVGCRVRPKLSGHPHLRRLFAFLGPALIGIGTIQAGILVDMQFAATFGDGPVSWLQYAFRLVQLPMNLFAGAVAIAALATLSSQVARVRLADARATLGQAWSLVSFFALPSAAGLALLAGPIVRMFYERGAFSTHDTEMTAQILLCYSAGVVAFCLHRLLVPAFYAWHDPWTPMLLSIATVLLKIPLALWWTMDSVLGLLGIPLAHATVATIEVVLLGGLLLRRTGALPGLLRDHRRIAGATGVMVAAGVPAVGLANGALATIGVVFGLGLLYFGVAYATGAPQARQVVQSLRDRLAGPRVGLPPHIDETTRLALEKHHGAVFHGLVLLDGQLVVRTAVGRLVVSAKDSVVHARHEEMETEDESGRHPLLLTGILRLSAKPPPLGALQVQVQEQQLEMRAVGEALNAGAAAGPRISVGPAPKSTSE